MEKNIHDDRLDDYVRKSFEEYEESPASDMWGRIEQELPPVGQKPVTGPANRPIRRYLWQMSAAASILLLISSLVCGRLYYENRIREISAAQQNIPSESKATQKSAQSPYPAESVTANKEANQEHASASKGTTAALYTADSPTNRIPSSSTRQTEAPLKNGSIHTKTLSAGVIVTPTPAIPGNATVASGHNMTETALPAIATTERTPTQANAVDHSAAIEHAGDDTATPGDFPTPINDLPILEPKKITFIAYTVPGFQQPSFPIKPSRTPSGWYLGLQITPTLLVEKENASRPGTIRPHVISTQEKLHFTADYWLKAGKQLSGRWGFESGIGYRTLERSNMHRARFRFMNGRPGGGGQTSSYDFDYDLDTYGGSTEVTLRMEQVDSNTVVPEDEPLQFQVKTSERLQLLRLPVLLTAHMGRGRLTGVLKAGLIGNVALRNEIEIVTRVSENTRFRPGEGSNAYILRPDKTQKFFMGYQVSAGLEYRPTKHFSWVLEPTLAGDFARKNSAGKQLPAIVTVGLNAGMNYYF
jgi:hypothetical protein